MTILLSLLLACGPSYYDAQELDTIEAYASFLGEVSESHPDYWKATLRLEEKHLEKAREMGSLEGYDLYLAKYQGVQHAKHVAAALEEREEFLYTWAGEENTVASWESFLEEYPRAKKKRKQEARRRIKMLGYAPHLEQGEVVLEQVNLAEDPEGPLNGWGVRCPFTNAGEQVIEYLSVQIDWLDAEGRSLETRTWPLVAPSYPVPVEEELKVPIEPGETRDFTYAAEPPESERWSETVKLTPVAIRLRGEASAEE